MNQSKQTDRILLLLAIALFIYIALQRSCDGGGTGGSADTVYVKGVPDTVILHDTTLRFVDIPIAVKSYVYIRDTVELPDSDRSIINPCDSIRIYTDSIEDGVCKVILKDSIRGELLGWSAELRSRKMEITRVDTLKITAFPDRLRAGVGLGYSNQLFPYLHLSKGRIEGMAGYQIKDKSLLLGVGVRVR